MTEYVVVHADLFEGLPDGWSFAPFGNVVDYQEGPGILAKDFTESGVPLLRLKSIERPTATLDGCNYLDFSKVKAKWDHFRLQKEDLLLSSSASLGRVSEVGEQASGSIAYTGIIRMRPKHSRASKGFIRYFLQSNLFKFQIERSATGSVIKHFGPMHLKQMGIPQPPIDEQESIAHILGALDGKIEINMKMNQTLEEIAKAIFKSWFVDFDPVRAKAEGRPTGLPPEVSDLFPDELVESEIGEIPGGWNVSQISSLANITMGQSPPGNTYNDDGVGLPFYQGNADFGFRYPSLRKYCSEPKRIAQENDVLLSVRAPVGDINRAMNECCIGRGLASIRHLNGAPSWIFYRCLFLKKRFDAFNSEGTVFGSVNGKDLKAVKSVAPTQEVVDIFESVVGPIDQSIKVRTEEAGVLFNMRDTLLPKLISGELRVPDAEKFLKQAGI